MLMLVLRGFSVGDACFYKFLLMLLVLMLVLWGFSVGDACFCQFLLMMLASGFDAGSAGVFCWGCLLLPAFANDAGFWF